MRLVIADTGPINYLILIGHIDILPALFQKVILPSAVRDELIHARTPPSVRNWIAALPGWVEIRRATHPWATSSRYDLGAGETAALALAAELHADLVLLDDRQAVSAAHEMGIPVTGTIGLLARASGRGLIDLPEAFARLKLTNFRYKQETMDSFLLS